MAPTKHLFLALLLAAAHSACTKPTKDPSAGDTASTESSQADKEPEKLDEPPATAERSESGLRWVVLKQGTGTARPRPWDNARMDVVMRLPNGAELMSSKAQYPDGVDLPLNDRMIPGWREAVTLMVPGERRRYWIPGSLAYGEAEEGVEATADRPLGTLMLDVELLEVTPNQTLPAVPEDLNEPPKRAKTTKSGLRYLVLDEGSGKKHPKKGSSVRVRYSGWMSDGTLISTTEFHGQPARMSFDDGIPGWQEALRMMVPGDKRRFWIPEALAYDGRPGSPNGDLVYDIELVSVEP